MSTVRFDNSLPNGRTFALNLSAGLSKGHCTFNMEIPSITYSFNAASLTDGGVGSFGVAFTNPMLDTLVNLVGSSADPGENWVASPSVVISSTINLGYGTANISGVAIDAEICQYTMYGEQP